MSVPDSSRTFAVMEHGGSIVLRTDDWVEAEAACLLPAVGDWPETYRRIKGTHPTHEWDEQNPRRCGRCGGYDNGSYGSHAPCGYIWGTGNLWAAVKRELEARGSSLAELRPDLARAGRA